MNSESHSCKTCGADRSADIPVHADATMRTGMSALQFTRRTMLQRSAGGFGFLALQAMLGRELAQAAVVNPLAPKQPQFPARAKRIVFLLMKGGPSHVDTFDPKPLLQRDHGKPYPFKQPRVQFAETGKLLKSPWSFRQYGQSGLPVSELFPNVAQCVDDLCIVRSLHGTNPAHGGACLKLHTGSDTDRKSTRLNSSHRH